LVTLSSSARFLAGLHRSATWVDMVQVYLVPPMHSTGPRLVRVTTRRIIVRSCPLLYVSLGYLDHGSLFTSLVRWGDLSVPINLARLTYLWLCERMAVRIGG